MPRTELFNKTEILTKCAHLFQSKGYHATSIQDLVDVTSLNRSSIYNTFGSKQNLYLLSLQFYEKKYLQKIQALLLDANTPLSALESFFAFALKGKFGATFLTKSASEMAKTDVEIRDFLNANRVHMTALFETIVNKGQLKGVFNYKKTATEYAHFLFSALQGLIITHMLLDHKESIENQIKTTLSILN